MYEHKTHYTKHPLYPRWNCIIQRCTNPNYINYSQYGGRGICVEIKWLPPVEQGFANFVNDMIDTFPEIFNQHGYFNPPSEIAKYLKATAQFDGTLEATPRITIDRVDNNAGYYISNIRWATYRTQTLNRRASKIGRLLPTGVTWRGKKNKYQSYYCYTNSKGKSVYKSLGYYDNLFDAVCARKAYELKRNGQLFMS